MRPQLKAFRDFFNSKSRFVVPVYQRAYSWKLERWSNLWRDLAYIYLETKTQPADGRKPADHFMGTLITELATSIGAGDVADFRIVDGQQRLATIYILLAAIRDFDHYITGKPLKEVNALSHILDPDEPEDPSPAVRFVVQKDDQAILQAIASGVAAKKGRTNHRHSLYKAYEFFMFQLWRGQVSLEEALLSVDPKEQSMPPTEPRDGFEEDTLHEFWLTKLGKPNSAPIDLVELRRIVIQRLQVLELLLEGDDEDAALIFESVNSKTERLHQFDHIKNSVFVRLPSARDTVFVKDWDPVVSRLLEVSYSGKRTDSGDQFIYDYLIARGESKRQGTINKGRAYSQFMSRLDGQVAGPASRPGYESDFLRFLKSDLLSAAAVWPAAVGQLDHVSIEGRTLAVPPASNSTIKAIMELSAGPPVPLILHLLEGFFKGQLKSDDLARALGYVESFVARHGIVGTALSPFRSLFMQVMANIGASYDTNLLKHQLLDRNWPDDKETLEKALSEDLYDRLQSRQVNAILRGLEQQLAGAGAHDMVFGKGESEYSVEHVFPESGVNAAWAEEFEAWRLTGAKIKDIEKRTHRLGNLTAVAGKDNKRLSAKPFAKKKEALKKAIAPLRLHESIVSCSRWTSTEIDQRGTLLAKAAVERWPRPNR